MKNVIAFSLFGRENRYTLGMLENIDVINKLSCVNKNIWQVYIYYNDIPDSILYLLNKYIETSNKHNLQVRNQDSKQITIKLFKQDWLTPNHKFEGTFWRFYPLDHGSDVDILLSRDSDSRITEREFDLVNKFINDKNSCFHVIRDHEGHGTEILAGTFGCKVKSFHNLIKESNNSKFKSIREHLVQYNDRHKMNKQVDQIFLTEVIYPIIKDHMLAHISVPSVRYSDKDVLIKRHPNYVGHALLDEEIKYSYTRGILYFHQGWTDIVNCLPLVNYYCKRYGYIYLLMRKDAKPLVDYYTESIKNLTIIYEKKDKINNQNHDYFNIKIYGSKGINEFKKYIKFLGIGDHDKFRSDQYKGNFVNKPKFFVQSFYVNYDIPYMSRVNDFSYKRNQILEDMVYKEFIANHTDKYILYHEAIDKNRISPNLRELVNTGEIKLVNLNKKTNIFLDYVKVLENAKELHLLDSVWGAIAYLLDAKYKLFQDKGKKVFLYAKRGHSPMFTSPVQLSNWIIINN